VFYKKKWIFLIILYAFCLALYHFVNRQLMLTGVMAGTLAGSLLLFGIITAVCFAAALIIAVISKYSYAVWCGICKVKPKPMLPKTFWSIFTALCYFAVFVVFFKMIEY